MARSTPAAAGARPSLRPSRSWLTRRSAIGHCQFDCQRRQPPPPCAYKPSSRSVPSLPHTIIILASMIFTSIIIAFVFALAGVFQDPITDNLLFSLTILTLPSLSAVSNILHIAGPMSRPTLPMPPVLDPFSHLLADINISFKPTRALWVTTHTAYGSPTADPSAYSYIFSCIIVSGLVLCLIIITAIITPMDISGKSYGPVSPVIGPLSFIDEDRSSDTLEFGQPWSFSNSTSLPGGELDLIPSTPSVASSISLDDLLAPSVSGDLSLTGFLQVLPHPDDASLFSDVLTAPNNEDSDYGHVT
ncbi:hypothetical protein C8Q76DRAFT_703124 [Earliella scabrosa]|nr:hypothetical protein C8Q76DRAFT_703124 [Earliella scabrosa]